MVALYLVFLLLGLTVFCLAIFGNFEHELGFDHHFDFSHHEVGSDMDHPGLFSLRTISAFLAGFGVAGLLAKWVLHWGIGGQLLLGFATGLAIAALAYLIMVGFYSQQAGSVKDSKALIGKTAIVTTGTGDQGIGECRVDNNHYTFRELRDKDVKQNEIVKVIDSQVGLLVVEKI